MTAPIDPPRDHHIHVAEVVTRGQARAREIRAKARKAQPRPGSPMILSSDMEKDSSYVRGDRSPVLISEQPTIRQRSNDEEDPDWVQSLGLRVRGWRKYWSSENQILGRQPQIRIEKCDARPVANVAAASRGGRWGNISPGLPLGAVGRRGGERGSGDPEKRGTHLSLDERDANARHEVSVCRGDEAIEGGQSPPP